MRRDNAINVRNIIATIAIAASFILAIGLAYVSNQRSTYWVSSRDLTPGHLIDSTDFRGVKAAFGREASGYISTVHSPVGYSVSRFIAAGEFLNQRSLVENSGEPNVKLLSFAVAAPDFPASLKIGDAVNLYQVINDAGDGKAIPSQLVIEDVYVVDLNKRSENLGGISVVTVGIPNDFVERALNATRRGRMVIVINHG